MAQTKGRECVDDKSFHISPTGGVFTKQPITLLHRGALCANNPKNADGAVQNFIQKIQLNFISRLIAWVEYSVCEVTLR